MSTFLSEFASSGLLSNEWTLVVAIGLAFFMVQLALCAAFCFRIRGQERAIKRLCRDSKQGGDGRRGVRSLSGTHAWLHWVVANFPDDSTHRSNNFTRDDALQELDTRIASNGNYLLLQRMSVMAPLLGVVLTVAGFFWLNVTGEDQSLQNILSAVTPLISGVGTGAVLALINQLLLHVAGRRVESLRLTARGWFDTVIWNRTGSTPRGSESTIQSMERMVRETLADIHRLNETLNRASQMGVAMSALSEQARIILERKKSVVDHKATAPPATGGRFAAPLARTAPATRPTPKTQG
jgi:hypothetical protein